MSASIIPAPCPQALPNPSVNRPRRLTASSLRTSVRRVGYLQRQVSTMAKPVLTLEPLNADSFSEFLEQAVAGYASDNVAAGRWMPQDALSLARKETEQLLPVGATTPGHYFFGISVPGTPAPVGYLWLASMQRGSAKVAYIYQIVIKPEHRRHGYAREALRQAEAFAAEDGHAAMALNVFAPNTAAQALYRSLGYAVTNMNMAKPLSTK